MLRNIWQARELLVSLVRRDLIVRYQSSVLGFLWSFARPLALVVIFWVAFSVILRGITTSVPFALHILVGVLVWSYLAGAVAQGHGAVLGHANLIKKVKLPIEVFPTVTVAGNLINFLLGMVVVFPIVVVVMAQRHGFAVGELVVQILAFLALTALLTVLVEALTLIVSAVNVYYRDMESITDVGLQAWFYGTPIVYPMTMLYAGDAFTRLGVKIGAGPARAVEVLYWLNPMTPICLAYRRVLLYRVNPQDADQVFGGLEVSDAMLAAYLGVSVLTILALYLIAQRIFKRCAVHFADEV